MYVICSSALIVHVVGWKKWAGGEGVLKASVNYSADLFAVSTTNRVGNFVLD